MVAINIIFSLGTDLCNPVILSSVVHTVMYSFIRHFLNIYYVLEIPFFAEDVSLVLTSCFGREGLSPHVSETQLQWFNEEGVIFLA